MDPDERKAYMQGLTMMCASLAPHVSSEELAQKIVNLPDAKLVEMTQKLSRACIEILTDLGIKVTP